MKICEIIDIFKEENDKYIEFQIKRKKSFRTLFITKDGIFNEYGDEYRLSFEDIISDEWYIVDKKERNSDNKYSALFRELVAKFESQNEISDFRIFIIKYLARKYNLFLFEDRGSIKEYCILCGL